MDCGRSPGNDDYGPVQSRWSVSLGSCSRRAGLETVGRGGCCDAAGEAAVGLRLAMMMYNLEDALYNHAGECVLGAPG